MKKVITYGTYDLLHHGHIKLLERAKALGDWLIVGVTSENFDRIRGKINNAQSLIERVKAVEKTGIADEIIVEEYEGQKIDDIIKYGIDIFTVGSDWVGKFDYLKKYCDVVYLDRTQGISSTDIRAKNSKLRIKIIGDAENNKVKKFIGESKYVNGVSIADNEKYDAVYVMSDPSEHYENCKKALKNGKHVLCESPVAETAEQANELFDIAEKNGLILMDGIKTAYSTAYHRMLLLARSQKIGEIVSVDATCTSLKNIETDRCWNSLCEWGTTAMLPIFQLFGLDYDDAKITALFPNKDRKNDLFAKIDFTYPSSVASIKIGQGIKSEGELIISGTKGYIYVPSPWWKNDYFEIRYENFNENKRYFYPIDGEGIRQEIFAFVNSIIKKKNLSNISKSVSAKMSDIIAKYNKGEYSLLTLGNR
ncbi:MAG TPA: glycerol-3-phosphate cytidylyltransferase [Spirochaetaceae bacterium]|nr:glycerol-3-phosphate cytidylyltransferase [Spirochaetaceae bacterium]